MKFFFKKNVALEFIYTNIYIYTCNLIQAEIKLLEAYSTQISHLIFIILIIMVKYYFNINITIKPIDYDVISYHLSQRVHYIFFVFLNSSYRPKNYTRCITSGMLGHS